MPRNPPPWDDANAPQEPWTEEELRQLAELPATAEPPAELEERVVLRLREEGLLGASGQLQSRASRPYQSPLRRALRRLASVAFPSGVSDAGVRRPMLLPTAAWTAASVAFAAALFLAGMNIGHRQALRDTADVLAAANGGGAMQAAVRVQQAGTAWIDALGELEALAAAGSSEELAQGREVALAALHAAADRLARLDPDDPVAARLLRGLESAEPGQEDDGTVEVRRVSWF